MRFQQNTKQQRNTFHFLTTSSSTPSCLPALRQEQVNLFPVLDTGWSGGLQKPNQPPSSTIVPASDLNWKFWLYLSVSYLSIKGFRMVIPNKKNIRTEKPIIANPRSMARSSPALEGSFLCIFSRSPLLGYIFLFLSEADKAVLWEKWERDISKSS